MGRKRKHPVKKCETCKAEFQSSNSHKKYCSSERYWEDKKGCITWNKGLKGTQTANSGSFKKGLTPWNKGNINTVGSLHKWVERHKEQEACELCGEDNKELEWSNKYHLYKKNLDDFRCLCKKCHRNYDVFLRITQKFLLNNLAIA